MHIKERNPETGEIKQEFTALPGSAPTPQERIAQLEAQNAEMLFALVANDLM